MRSAGPGAGNSCLTRTSALADLCGWLDEDGWRLGDGRCREGLVRGAGLRTTATGPGPAARGGASVDVLAATALVAGRECGCGRGLVGGDGGRLGDEDVGGAGVEVAGAPVPSRPPRFSGSRRWMPMLPMTTSIGRPGFGLAEGVVVGVGVDAMAGTPTAKTVTAAKTAISRGT